MEQIDLKLSGQTTVTLKGLGGAGYRWSFTVDDPQVVSVERHVQERKPDDTHPPAWSSDEAFVLLGQKLGETVVRFRQARSFEPAKPPLATREILVRVHGK